MEIYKRVKNNYANSFITKYSKKRAFLVFLFLVGLIIFGFGCIVYGGYLNKTRQNVKIGKLIISLADFDFSFIPNKVNSFTSKVEKFDLDIKFIDFEKLRFSREDALKRVNGVKVDDHIDVPAKLKYKNEIYDVSVSLTGIDEVEPNSMHIIHPNKKWSYSIKVKRGKTIMGLRKFSLLVPRARGYLTDWIATALLKSRGVIGIRNDFVQMRINGDDLGIFYFEERYDQPLLENNNRKEGIIFRFEKGELSIHGMSRVLESEYLQSQAILLQRRYYNLINGQIEPHDFFDLKKMASFAVVSDIMNSKHALGLWNMRFYFNPTTLLCEPIGREWGYLQVPVKNKFITLFDSQNALLIEKPNDNTPYHQGILKNNPIFKDGCSVIFKELYLKEAEKLTKQSYLDSALLSDNSLDSLLKKAHKENPFYKFPLEQLHKNQEYIRDKINPSFPILEARLDNIANDSISIIIENKIDLPVEIKYLKYNGNQVINLSERIIIKANFETVEPKRHVVITNKNIGWPESFSSDFFEIYYSILGLNKIKKTIVFPKIESKNELTSVNQIGQTDDITENEILSANGKE